MFVYVCVYVCVDVCVDIFVYVTSVCAFTPTTTKVCNSKSEGVIIMTPKANNI